MFKFLKNIMNNEESTVSNDVNSVHRVLKTDIRKITNFQEDEIIFGCGCFWGAEKCFWKLPGVVTTSVGYAGGDKNNPTYYEVCSGLTGHSEVVRVIWDKDKIDLSDLLKMFWECHDPTQKNRQGNDIGSQYRSAIYFKNEINKNITIISHKKNYGQSIGLRTGIIEANSEYIVTLDGDGQNDPRDILKLIKSFDTKVSFMMVIGNRVNRIDSTAKKVASRLAFQIRKLLLKDTTPDTGCAIKVFRKKIFCYYLFLIIYIDFFLFYLILSVEKLYLFQLIIGLEAVEFLNILIFKGF